MRLTTSSRDYSLNGEMVRSSGFDSGPMPGPSLRSEADPDTDRMDKTDIDVLHEIGSRIAAADPLHEVLSRVVQFASSLVQCDSCFVYVLDEDTLVLRA